MEHNRTVDVVNIAMNPIGTDGAAALANLLRHNVCLTGLVSWDDSYHAPESEASIKSDTTRRNARVIPFVVRRASLFLIAARLRPTDMGTLGIFPKEIVKMIAIEVWATRTEPDWISACGWKGRTRQWVKR